jgi:trehalose-6-phosphatase
MAREALKDIPGVVINEKGAGFSIYDTSDANPDQTRARIEEFVRSIPGMTAYRSRRTFDCRPEEASRFDKGTALETFMRRFNFRQCAFLGDAENDAPAFELANRMGGFSIGVGDRRPASARLHLERQEDLDELLRRVIAARLALNSPRGRFLG